MHAQVDEWGWIHARVRTHTHAPSTEEQSSLKVPSQELAPLAASHEVPTDSFIIEKSHEGPVFSILPCPPILGFPFLPSGGHQTQDRLQGWLSKCLRVSTPAQHTQGKGKQQCRLGGG